MKISLSILFSICIVYLIQAQIYKPGHSQVEYNAILNPGLSVKNSNKGIFTSSTLSIFNDLDYRIDIGVRSSDYIFAPNHSYISSWNNQPLDFTTGLNETRLSIDSLGRVIFLGDDLLRDTVVSIKSNYTGETDMVGLHVDINPMGRDEKYGIAGYFRGGENGIRAESPKRWAVFGITETGLGVFGSSDGNGTGVHGFSADGIGTKGVGRNSYGVEGTTQSGNSYGVRGASTSEFGGGVLGNATNGTGVFGSSAGGYGIQAYSQTSVGVYAQTMSGASAGVYGSSNYIGVHGNGSTAGVYGYSLFKYGVEGHSEAPTSQNGFDFYASGSAPDWGTTSSQRWKNNIHNIPNPLELMSKIRGVYYDWDEEHGAGRHDIGFIAEEVGAVIPEIVTYEDNGIDAIAMDYTKIPALLVEAFNVLKKEYDQKFEKQEQQILKLLKRLDQVENLTASK